MNKLTLEQFIYNFKRRYPEKKYDFSKSVYTGNKNKMIVICPEHGEFEIRPNCLMEGNGCPKCVRTTRYDTEEFIRRATKVHNGYFKYNNTIFRGSNEKVVVTCPIHGDFEVKANNHLKGVNCKKCQMEGITHEITSLTKDKNSTKRLTTEDFIERSRQVHSNKYIYDKTQYHTNREKAIVTCPEHGDFEISPNKHLNGRGCPMCAGNKKLSTQVFIKRVQEKGLLKDCDLSKVNYISTHVPVCIICPKHGEYWASPANIFKGQGCPACIESALENQIRGFLETNGINFDFQKKFEWLGRQSLDFYLPEYNTAIECQGVQHFKPVEFYGGEENFQNQLERDELKKKLCECNGVTLLYYSDLDIEYPYQVYTDKYELFKTIKNVN